jgi:hypothetical protein
MESGLNIEWMTIIQYLLGAAGAYVLGQPAAKKVLAFIRTLLASLPKPAPAPKTVELSVERKAEIDSCCDDIERITAESLLNSAFVFRMQGNQAGVQHCLAAVAELTKSGTETKV